MGLLPALDPRSGNKVCASFPPKVRLEPASRGPSDMDVSWLSLGAQSNCCVWVGGRRQVKFSPGPDTRLTRSVAPERSWWQATESVETE